MEIISRKEAKEKGLKTFYTGKDCKYGHRYPRYTSNSICVRCSELRAERKAKTSKEPELDYAQIGKAIMERMKELESAIQTEVDLEQRIKNLTFDKKNALDKIGEQHDTILKLNKKITDLNDQLRVKQRSSVGENTFKLSEIATVKRS